MRLVLEFFLVATELQINTIPFKVVPLESHTPPEMLVPLLLAVLEVFMWKCPQLVCHNILMSSTAPKSRLLRLNFSFG